MAVDIVEYAALAQDQTGKVIQCGQEPANAIQQITESGTSQQSAAFGNATRMVRIHTTAAIRVLFGANPTAAATSQRIAANATEFFGVMPGMKVAVISTT